MQESIEERFSRLESLINEQAIQQNAFNGAVLQSLVSGGVVEADAFKKMQAGLVTVFDQLQALRRTLAIRQDTPAAASIRGCPIYEQEACDFWESMGDPDDA